MKVRWIFLLTVLVTGTVLAQQDFFKPSGASLAQVRIPPNASYNGRYGFVRIRYPVHNELCRFELPQGPGWHHDYPKSEMTVMKLITHVTRLDARTDSTLVFAVTDPELMKYPIAYMTEPGCWHPTDVEAKAMRAYLMKGGFLIVDDFTLGLAGEARFKESRDVFEQEIKRVLPNSKLIRIDPSDPVFNGIFTLERDKLFPPLSRGVPVDFYGIYEDNDPSKRLLVAANYNNDINKYWHMSARGFSPVEVTNTAYQLGINYLIYGFMY